MTEQDHLRMVAESYANLHDRITVLMGERDKALAERDDARRKWCNDEATRLTSLAVVAGMSDHVYTGSDIARMHGWDCFKENNQ